MMSRLRLFLTVSAMALFGEGRLLVENPPHDGPTCGVVNAGQRCRGQPDRGYPKGE